MLIGYEPDQGGRAALDLGAQLARSAGEDAVAVTVVPAPWPVPSMARVDGEFADWASQHGAAAGDQAREYVAAAAADVKFEAVAASGKSVPSTLVRVARERGADVLVIGSSSDGRHGRIAVGSTATHLLHSSPIPVALAPRGYRVGAGTKVARVTCSFAATPEAAAVLRLAATVASRVGADLRVATFGVRGRTMFPPEVGLRAEDDVLAAWRSQAGDAQEEALRVLREADVLPPVTTSVMGTGPNWTDALEDLDWQDAEVLVIGSSHEGPLGRLFLGSRAAKIVRHSPVPVIVVPVEAAAAAAEDALVPVG